MCGKIVWGLFFIILGAAWIAGNLGLIQFNIGDWWPIVFVLIGIGIVFSKPPWEKFREEFPCGKLKDVDWDDEDIRDEVASAVERISKKVAKKIRYRK